MCTELLRYSLDKEIVDLETTVANVCCKLFTKTSIVAIDDDKVRVIECICDEPNMSYSDVIP